jgi:SAM-dependent methyltransferase
MPRSLLEIPPQFNRSASPLRNPAAAEESALFLIRYVCDTLGLADLSAHEVLDVGCGTKFTQAFLNHDLPIKRYVGVDVYEAMIEFLRENVTDPRFAYHHIDVRNELYNPAAPPMTDGTDLGVGDHRFDVIWLFSVFTHLAPHDYRTMLKLLRRYGRPESRLIYTLFVDELTDDGWGVVDRMNRSLRERQPGGMVDRAVIESLRKVKPFVDLYPEHPLRCALYSREHAYELIDGTGWRPLELLPPNEFAQHCFVCAPE